MTASGPFCPTDPFCPTQQWAGRLVRKMADVRAMTSSYRYVAQSSDFENLAEYTIISGKHVWIEKKKPPKLRRSLLPFMIFQNLGRHSTFTNESRGMACFIIRSSFELIFQDKFPEGHFIFIFFFVCQNYEICQIDSTSFHSAPNLEFHVKRTDMGSTLISDWIFLGTIRHGEWISTSSLGFF